MVAELETRLYATAQAVCAFVRRSFAVSYTAHAMAKLLKRLGFVYRKPKGVPARADAETQRRFVEETLAPLLAKAGVEHPGAYQESCVRGHNQARAVGRRSDHEHP